MPPWLVCSGVHVLARSLLSSAVILVSAVSPAVGTCW